MIRERMAGARAHRFASHALPAVFLRLIAKIDATAQFRAELRH
jgi:hypothetical protein